VVVRIGLSVATLAVVLGLVGCDYWAPPLESKITDEGGTYVVWWIPDNSSSFEVRIRYLNSDSTFQTATGDNLYFKAYVAEVELRGLDRNGQNQGFSSGWAPAEITKSARDCLVYPRRDGSLTRPFGIQFDSVGRPATICRASLLDPKTPIVFWIDSTGTELIGVADSGGPRGSVPRARLARADSSYPVARRISPPPDTSFYHSRVSLTDSTDYWLWVDNDPPGFDETDHFAEFRAVVWRDDSTIAISTGYQSTGGLRWMGW
jgi:hypothetical protein